ncbi:MAG: prolipoprotein diacylglyceryl transferase [Lachnospiraceae bacterium]|nr:prolipoprotein diacylglyceryl transferase [Lachnospiraceae bacterium]
MMNELFTIGPVTIYGYGLMIAIGAVAALLVTEYRLKKAGLQYDFVYTLTVFALLGGMIGAKLLYLIVELPQVMKDPSMILNFGSGFVVYGGIIGGVIAGYIFAKIKKLSFWRYMDYVMPSIILAQGFGRIGCFLAGCCYGKETDSIFGIVFHDSPHAPSGVKLVPTQLMFSAWDFLCFFLLVWIQNKKIFKKEGNVAALYFLFYGIGRFILEFFRADDRGTVGFLSTSQFISIFIVLLGMTILALGKFRKEIVTNEEGETNEEV